MLRLVPGPPPEPDTSSLHAPWLEEELNDFAYNYTWEPDGLIFWRDLPTCTTEQVEYLPHLVFRPGKRCCSSGDFIPLHTILDTVLSKKVAKADGDEDGDAGEDGEPKDKAMAREFPALYALNQKLDGHSTAASSSGGPLEEEQPVFDQKLDLDEDSEMEEFWDKMEHIRGKAHGIRGHDEKDFRARLRGGESEVRKHKQRFDAWQGQTVTSSAAYRWCREHNYQTAMQFPLTMGVSCRQGNGSGVGPQNAVPLCLLGRRPL